MSIYIQYFGDAGPEQSLVLFSSKKFSQEYLQRVKQFGSRIPDQVRHFVGPDLDPNCLQRLSAEDTSKQRIFASVFRQYLRGARCMSQVKLEGKVAIVTGANTGIGRHVAEDLANRGNTVARVKVFRINPKCRILRLTLVESQPQNAELRRL